MAKKKETPKPKPKSAKSKPEPKEKTVADANENENQPQQNQPKPVGGPADDTSVRGFADKCKELATDVMSGDYIGAFKTGGNILSVAADLFGLPNIFGAEEGAGGDDAAALDEAKKNVEECKAKAEGPQPVGAATGDPAKAIDPATILMLIQFVMGLIDAIRKRRNPTA